MVKRQKLLRLDEMEPIAREATRQALSQYPEPGKDEQSLWTLAKIETKSQGIFEIYIPAERSIDAKVVSCATVDRETGAVQVEIFLDKATG